MRLWNQRTNTKNLKSAAINQKICKSLFKVSEQAQVPDI